MFASTAIRGTCRRIAVFVTLMATGCSDMDPSPVGPPVAESPADLPAMMPPAGPIGVTDERPGETTFVNIAAAEPSFAGFFIEGDELVVLAATGAVGSTGTGGTGGGGGPGDQSPGGGIGPVGSTGVPPEVADSLRTLVSGILPFDVSSVSVRTAEHSFLQLSGWRDLLEPTIWTSDDVVALDLDELNNRLTVSLVEGTGEETIRNAARDLGVPDAAIGFEVTGEIELLASTLQTLTLRSTIRPVRGGTQIGTSGCTYGFNAVRAADTVMVTNSHCTSGMFSVDGDRAYQSVGGGFIGTEVTDPGFYWCGVFRSRRCRKSDAAAFRLSLPSRDIGLYQISRTTYRRKGTRTSGSVDIDSDNPYFTIVAEYGSPVAGGLLNKIGVRTGWTYGLVKNTCEVERIKVNGVKYHITCAYKMDARTDDGDSGSPVFRWDGWSDDVDLAGLVFAKDGDNKGVFSSLRSIEQELGSMRTYDLN